MEYEALKSELIEWLIKLDDDETILEDILEYLKGNGRSARWIILRKDYQNKSA